MSSTNPEARNNPEDNLTPAELAELARLEVIARRGLGPYLQVGTALAEIRDRHLYRGSHPSFEAYVRERWDVTLPSDELSSHIAMGGGVEATPTSERGPRAALNETPGEALAKACEETLAALAGRDGIGIEIRLAVHNPQDPGSAADGQTLDPSKNAEPVSRELLPVLRWLLTQASGTLGLIAHELESRAADIDDAARAQLRDDVLVLDDELDTVKALLAELVDWDSELGRLLNDELPPFDTDADPDDD